MPRVGPDTIKMEKIRTVLKDHPSGLWIREIARKARLDKSTVSIYLSRHMRGEVEDTHPRVGNDLIRVVRLRK